MGSIDKIIFVLCIHYDDVMFLMGESLLPTLFYTTLKQVNFFLVFIVEEIVVDWL